MHAERTRRFSWRALVAVGFVAAGTAVGGTAFAGECPAEKRGLDVTKPGAKASKDATDTVLAAIDLAGEPAGIQDRQFRLRRLEIKPGGEIAWHSHGDRPALIYIVKGEILEYASNCAVPIVHKAGDVARETSVTSHWWKNAGKDTVVLLSADLLHDAADKNM